MPRVSNSIKASWIWSIFGTVLLILVSILFLIILAWGFYSTYMVMYYPKIDKTIDASSLSTFESLKLLYTLRMS
ncbi:hypothetical protein OrNV_gp063 [Oryctes rhinoceros nudivirus]|uniref:Uncharacterized protein n=1 Tax=Oryctes rhinoceros nudivirus TaxID=92521 RepID=A0A6B9QQX5_9VIRU|nr:hypothetical protein OrNV_gp063 [Oryctes rhinoceros nudivirus]ACH96193.1 unknown [Oryctes rhinoceros nudivirus]QHG11300.1 hypothetical protein SI_OrNV_gp063 [Oryctes rhinoceros nudivirus]QKE59534.1 hypothetical protein SI_OrNV_gp063 [Oryctes rhinoceros nudivirus]UBO76481.1 hypothetical protein SI_OrNV_gp063 [Oryctes rhinoceros nudivirus]UBR58243.1 hypothetical protein [Oryctes rhinoceros nudivirus]